MVFRKLNQLFVNLSVQNDPFLLCIWRQKCLKDSELLIEFLNFLFLRFLTFLNFLFFFLYLLNIGIDNIWEFVRVRIQFENFKIVVWLPIQSLSIPVNLFYKIYHLGLSAEYLTWYYKTKFIIVHKRIIYFNGLIDKFFCKRILSGC